MGRRNRRVQRAHTAAWKGRKSRRNHERTQRILYPLKALPQKCLSLIFVWSIAFGLATAKVHNRSKSFIDIEVPSSQIWVTCVLLNPEERRSIIVVYVKEG